MVPITTFLILVFRSQIQEAIRTALAIRRKKEHVKVLDTGEMVSGDTDKFEIKKVNGHNGHEHLVKAIECHAAMNKIETMVSGVSVQVVGVHSRIGELTERIDKLFEIQASK